MIVMFINGPAAGLYKNLPKQDEYRVGTESLVADGKVAYYRLAGSEYMPKLRHELGTAEFVGVIDSAASLADLVVEDISLGWE